MPVLHASLRRAGVLLLAGWMAACGPDLLPDPEEPSTPSEEEHPDPNMRHEDHGDGTFTTTVDATSDAVWIGLDLDHRLQVSAAEDSQWDLAFQRFHIRSRGGVNGTGPVKVAILPEADFAQVQQAPADGYLTDGEDETAFDAEDGWYSYDVKTHTLSPRPRVYIVQTDEGAFFKVQMISYYDTAGTSAMPQLRWGLVQPPVGAELHEGPGHSFF